VFKKIGWCGRPELPLSVWEITSPNPRSVVPRVKKNPRPWRENQSSKPGAA
jgi:hypothetical protein